MSPLTTNLEPPHNWLIRLLEGYRIAVLVLGLMLLFSSFFASLD